MLETINAQWVRGNANGSPLHEPDKRDFVAPHTKLTKRIWRTLTKPKPQKNRPKDEGRPFLTVQDYLVLRLEDQLEFYEPKARELNHTLTNLRVLTVGLGGVGTLLAALKGELFITLTTAIITALTTYIEYMQLSNTIQQYNQAAASLTDIKDWWLALNADGQADRDNLNKLVDFTETTLQTEAAGWVQQMQTALTDLKAQQARQGASSVGAVPFEPGEIKKPKKEGVSQPSSVSVNGVQAAATTEPAGPTSNHSAASPTTQPHVNASTTATSVPSLTVEAPGVTTLTSPPTNGQNPSQN